MARVERIERRAVARERRDAGPAERQDLQQFAGEQVVRFDAVAGGDIGDAVGHLDLHGGNGDALQEYRRGSVGDIDQMQCRPGRDRGDAEARIDGDVDGIAGKVELAQDERGLEAGSIDDRQAVRAAGDIGGLHFGAGRRAFEGDGFGLALQRESGDDAGWEGAATKRITTGPYLAQVADAIVVAVREIITRSQDKFGNAIQSIPVNVAASRWGNNDARHLEVLPGRRRDKITHATFQGVEIQDPLTIVSS